MLKVLALLFVIGLGAAPGPEVHGVSVPRNAVKGVPWSAVIAVTPPARAVLRGVGAKTITRPLRARKKRGRYRATLRFPFAGYWRVAVTAGRKTTPLRTVFVDVQRDPLVKQPCSL